MPMVIPMVAAFAAGAAGVAAVATATTVLGTIAAYATIAGAVMTGVGALTGSKDLMKIGAVLSIGGGLTGLAAGAGEAAAGAGASDYVNGADLASDAAAKGTQAATVAAAPEAVAPTTSVDYVNGADMASDAATAPQAGAVPTMQPTSLAAKAADTGAKTPMLDGSGAGSTGIKLPDPSAVNPNGFGKPVDYSAPPVDRIAATAGRTTTQDLTSWYEKAKAAGGAVAQFIEKNPALVKVGGDMLSSMYGPAAEKFDYEKGLMERARAALNNPVQLKYMKPGG